MSPSRPEESRDRVSSKDVLERLGSFVGGLEGIELRVPEDDAAVARGALFAPRLAAALDEAVDLLKWAEAHYEREQQRRSEVMETADSLTDIGRLISWEIAGQEITDQLFLARSELRGARQDLVAAIDQEDFLRVTSSCDSGLRTLKRTMISVESVLHDYEGLEPPRRQWTDLEVSLQNRRLYGQLRRQILGGPRPDERPVLEQRLGEVAGRLAAIRDLEIYPLLRFDDRVALRDLRQRIEEWLAAPYRDLRSGTSLWQDLTGFAEMLKGVNHRQELRQHDRSLVRRTYRRLFDPGAPPLDPDEGPAYELAPLLGLDDELDELLLKRAPGDGDSWRRVLTRLLHSLSWPRPHPV